MPTNRISKINFGDEGGDRIIKDGTNFVGTLAQWDALTDAQKEQYDTYDIDDYSNPQLVTANDFFVNDKTLYFPEVSGS